MRLEADNLTLGLFAASILKSVNEIDVQVIFDRVPGTVAFKRQLMAFSWGGKKQYPTSLPLRRAVAVAAAAAGVAQDCGAPTPSKVFDLLTGAAGEIDGMLVVFPGRGGSPKLVDAAFWPTNTPAIVVDLDEITRRLVGD